jgi:hypothetical protein
MLFSKLVVFCAKGHLAVELEKPEDLDCLQNKACPICGCKNLKAVPDWPAEYTNLVPAEPIGQVNGVPLYNVEALFAEEIGVKRSLAFFCANGHLAAVTTCPDGDEAQKLKPCHSCGSRHFRAVFDWLQDAACVVPPQEVRYDGDEPVYDISKLFAPDFQCEWDIDLDQLFPAIKARD